MASAILANHRTESDWTQPKFMGEAPFPKSNLNPIPNPNPNPNPNVNSNYRLANSKKRQFHHDDLDDSPAVTQSAASDDASSINRRPNNTVPNFGTCVNFSVSSFSKAELIELKSRFVAELERVRQLRRRIEYQDTVVRSSTNHTPAKKGGVVNKKITGNKRLLPSNFSKDLKRMNSENGNLMKACGQILTKLMKHKYGYIFNTPVDVVGLELHDYCDIIKNPMDLGTVKTKLSNKYYESPMHFAADVRLTFSNAMLYNPKGHEIYVLADQFLSRFEDLFRPVDKKLKEEEKRHDLVYEEELQGSSWDRVDQDDSVHIARIPEQMCVPAAAMSNPKTSPPPPPPPVAAAEAPSPPRLQPQPVKPLKQPKPKAKDPNKREMSLEEKHKLGVELQNLPQEKMENVVQIIKKRNDDLTQDGDEIELDIEAVDTETLWELDRFVINHKKMVSKMKRQALMGATNSSADAVSEANKEMPVTEKMDMGDNEAKKARKGEAGDEDVDIGDEMPMSNFPPVEIEKDNGYTSSSSSDSSSDSSSASDSDSGSSSGSDSDADDARS